LPDSVPSICLAKIDVVVLDGDRHGGPIVLRGLIGFSRNTSLIRPRSRWLSPPQNGGRHAWFKQPTEGAPLGNRDAPIKIVASTCAEGWFGHRSGHADARWPATPAMSWNAAHDRSIPDRYDSGVAAIVGRIATCASKAGYVAHAEPLRANGSGHARGRREEAYAEGALHRQMSLRRCAPRAAETRAQ
jgi:hypothetical protein